MHYRLPLQDFYRSSDPAWMRKLIWGATVALISLLLTPMLVGVLGWLIIAGYGLHLLRNVQGGEQHPLPAWNQPRADLHRGFKLAVVALVWSMPLVVLGAFMSVVVESVVVGSVVVVLGGLYSLFAVLAAPAYCIRMAQAHSTISDGLRCRELVHWTCSHLGQVVPALAVGIAVACGLWLVSLLGGIAFGGIAFVLGLLLTPADTGLIAAEVNIVLVLGLLVTVPLTLFVAVLYGFHLCGQLARVSAWHGGQKPVVGRARAEGREALRRIPARTDRLSVPTDSRRVLPGQWADLLDRSDVLIVDTETNGLDQQAEVLDVAVVDTRGRVLFTAVFQPDRHDPQAAAVHGLTPDRLRKLGAGKWAATGHHPVAELLGRAHTILAWNAPFDQRMLDQTAARYGCPPLPGSDRWHDLLGDHRRYETGSHKLADVAARCGISGTQTHRALDDCRLVLAVMRAIVAQDPVS